MTPKLPIAAITDEFSPDLETALHPMKEIGMQAAELRVVYSKNIMDLDDTELSQARDTLNSHGFQVISIASPLLKCVLPGAPPVDSRFQQDMFAAKHTYEDQPRLTEHAFNVARLFGARIIRVFSYWRTIEPEQCLDAVATALDELAAKAAPLGLTIGLENEHACNIATAAESARILDMVKRPNLMLVWDPANAYVAGEIPFPDGYNLLPPGRIVHVHAKDCEVFNHTPEWGPLGTRAIDWKGQIAALLADGYQGYLSLETHWPGPNNNKLEASRICGWNLRGLASA
ncbi:MAG TPA: sugar phosphate isomerase/epimerase family protein [Candidatus Acidoferrum sp.]|nr:sugar phosphate isomerase/epimerase family protein [Candidatus Acidoferrum sp.]